MIENKPVVSLKKPEHTLPCITPVHITEEIYPNGNVTPLPSYTPIHHCDEIYTPIIEEKQCDELVPMSLSKAFAQLLLDNLIESSCLRSDFFWANADKDNFVIDGNRVIYALRDTPISKKYKKQHSDVLDCFQDLVSYMEQPSATFDGLCEYLEIKCEALKEWKFYHEFSKFLYDIKTGNTSKIIDVLKGEHFTCYDSILHRGFSTEVSCYFFSCLFNILKRETSIQVHPLFLFACENFRTPEKDVCRNSLVAYGIANEDNLEYITPDSSLIFNFISRNDREIIAFSGGCAGIGLIGLFVRIFGGVLINPRLENLRSLCGLDVYNSICAGFITLGTLITVFTFLTEGIGNLRFTRKTLCHRWGGLKMFAESSSALTTRQRAKLLCEAQLCLNDKKFCSHKKLLGRFFGNKTVPLIKEVKEVQNGGV